MSYVTFADVVHQSISFSEKDPAERLILSLLDSRWVQRLRDISQTANTRLVYMFSEHSRFGHSLGVAYLAKMLLEKLSVRHARDVELFKPAILVAALVHDIGHLAPGSHTAFKTWFPGQSDSHESIAVKILNEDEEIQRIIQGYSRELLPLVTAILSESDTVPPWTWQTISGGGWNVDRGNWSVVDSVLAGVSYGKYNIPALVESIVITDAKDLALMENRLDSMMHFMVSRHAMYRQVYQHRVLLAADTLNTSIVQRARDLGRDIPFADTAMSAVLSAQSVDELSLKTLFHMREPWWRYHLTTWSQSSDTILSDLSDRLLHRRLFKTIRVRSDEDSAKLKQECSNLCAAHNLDPRYYVHEVYAGNVHSGDTKQSMLVMLDNGAVIPLGEADPLFHAMVSASRFSKRSWLVVPDVVKTDLGRSR
jgi:HD superfamily phosphohydrolase